MNAEELKVYVEAQGYTHVSVQAYKNSFRVNYWTPDVKIQRRLGISISLLPVKFDGSKWALWLIERFPCIVPEKTESS